MLLGIQRIRLEVHVARIMCVRSAYIVLVAAVEGQKKRWAYVRGH